MRLLEFVRGKRLILLGGTGIVGRVLLSSLIEAGPEHILVTGQRQLLDDLPEGIEYLQASLPSDISVLSLRADYVIALAAMSRPDKATRAPEEAIAANVETTRVLLEHYANTPTRIVLTSSVRSSTLGDVYSATKNATEMIGAGWSGTASVVTVRLGNIIESSRAIQSYENMAWGFGGGYLSSGYDYFQPSFSIPYVFHLALDPDTESATIITPLLPRVPLLFIAGYLAGVGRAEEFKQQEVLGGVPVREGQDVELLPRWWYPHSHKADLSITVANKDRKYYFVTTNFAWRSNDEEATELRNRVEEAQRQPNIAEVLQWLDKEE